jgi:hypothetical protein
VTRLTVVSVNVVFIIFSVVTPGFVGVGGNFAVNSAISTELFPSFGVGVTLFSVLATSANRRVFHDQLKNT